MKLEIPTYFSMMPGEKLLCEIWPSKLAFMGGYLAGTTLLVAGVAGFVGGGLNSNAFSISFGMIGMLLGVCWLIKTVVKMQVCRASLRYAVTNARVVAKEGLVSISTVEVRMGDIRSVCFHQSFLERLCGVGTIAIGSAATGGMELGICGIREPQKVMALINRNRGMIA